VILLDNNALAHPHGIHEMEKTIDLKIRVDYNQGLDARLITLDIAKLLSRMHWIRNIRIACDSIEMIDPVVKTVSLLGKQGIKPYKIFVYLLIQDIHSALVRIKALRKLKVDIFAQVFRNVNGDKSMWILSELERYVNVRKMFKTHTFEEFLEFRKAMFL